MWIKLNLHFHVWNNIISMLWERLLQMNLICLTSLQEDFLYPCTNVWGVLFMGCPFVCLFVLIHLHPRMYWFSFGGQRSKWNDKPISFAYEWTHREFYNIWYKLSLTLMEMILVVKWHDQTQFNQNGYTKNILITVYTEMIKCPLLPRASLQNTSGHFQLKRENSWPYFLQPGSFGEGEDTQPCGCKSRFWNVINLTCY